MVKMYYNLINAFKVKFVDGILILISIKYHYFYPHSESTITYYSLLNMTKL